MRVLVLQSRYMSDPMLEHERGCFVAATRRSRRELYFRNVITGIPKPEEIATFDALIIGGSGDFSVAERDQPFFGPMTNLMKWVVDRGFPTFGCCFGYQLLVDAMGGRVIRDPARAELGSVEIELTDEGVADPLFGQLPRRFVAQLGHFDRAIVLPKGVPNLAMSESCPHQALRVPGAPIWATQFHPELDQQGNRDRCVAYINEFDTIEGYQALPSPDALSILPRFLDLVGDFQAWPI